MNFEQELVKVLDKYYWKTMLTRPWILHRSPLFKEIWYEVEKTNFEPDFTKYIKRKEE